MARSLRSDSIVPLYLKVLRKIQAQLNQSDVNWAVTGSLCFVLQGLPVEPNDIDLQTDEAGAYEIERRFLDFVTRPVKLSATERIRSYWGELTIDGVKVEIMGDIQQLLEAGCWGSPPDLAEHKRYVAINGMSVPVMSLDYEYTAYLNLGRFDKAEQLRRWLDADRT